MKRCFHFFGSVTFAVILIVATALFVTVGTILESLTDSHAFAASLTYDHPVFTALLLLYFVNILFSALRRFPFKRHHIPFLTTHLGLLMVLTGVIIKNLTGVQGTLLVDEGSASHTLFIAKEKEIEIKETDGRITAIAYNLAPIRAAVPHSETVWSGWIKDGALTIRGLEPLPLSADPLQPLATIKDPEDTVWMLFASRVHNVSETIAALYEQSASLPPHSLQLDYTPFDGLTASLAPHAAASLIFLQDPAGDVHLATIAPNGALTVQCFFADHWKRLIVYNDGFHGYAHEVRLSPHCTLEADALRHYKPIPPPVKLEERRPALRLALDNELVSVRFDPTGDDLPTPTHSGRQVRFQPKKIDIPYRVRIHRARQVSYANTGQPFSYECLATITDRNTGNETTATLSMNRVFETWDGYRFYLSSLTPPHDGETKRVSIAVNQDPAKYLATYPGATLIALGATALFLRHRRRF